MVLLGEQIKGRKNVKFINKDFQLFKKECNKWIDKLGLGDWDVLYSFESVPESAGSTEVGYEGCWAIITLSPDYPNDDMLDKNPHIKKVALHECLELLLATLNILGKSRIFDEAEFNHERHRVINSLMRIL